MKESQNKKNKCSNEGNTISSSCFSNDLFHVLFNREMELYPSERGS